jgi:hypothetical protein
VPRDAPSLDVLRELAAQQGVEPSDEDLEAAAGFLRVLLPQLRRLEELVPAEAEP